MPSSFPVLHSAHVLAHYNRLYAAGVQFRVPSVCELYSVLIEAESLRCRPPFRAPSAVSARVLPAGSSWAGSRGRTSCAVGGVLS